MKTIISVFLIFASFVCSAQKSQIFKTEEGAIHGYDPVAYFNTGSPVKGKKEFSYSWKGADWYFVSASNLKAFKASPEKFAPQYGGYCAYGCSEGHKAPTDPTAWTIVDGKLYLNYSPKVKELWTKDRPARIITADKNWPELVGKE